MKSVKSIGFSFKQGKDKTKRFRHVRGEKQTLVSSLTVHSSTAGNY